jgi:hypothetical protein
MHNEQVYTGLAALSDEKLIQLNVQIAKDKNGKPIKNNLLSISKLTVNGVNSIIDTHDNFGLYTDGYLEDIQHYFKRSYQLQGYKAEEDAYNIQTHALGLNYAIYGKQQFWLPKYLIEKTLPKKLEVFCRNNFTLSKIFHLNTSAGYCNEQYLSAEPNFNLEPQALLMTRVWPIHNKLQPWQIEKRTHLNKLRTECIMSLREAFGDKFLGGLFIDEYAAKYYPNLLLSNNKMAAKKNYLKTLKQFPIGISVNGLFSSGWSLGEYAALSKAIVTDYPTNVLPGNFLAQQNYLAFSTADECVQSVKTLMDNPDLCRQIMTNNHRYYLETLNPKAMMWSVIQTILGKTHSTPLL